MVDPVRLQKFLANAGVASRRRSEELITAGRVEVDGTVVTRLGSRVDPHQARVHVDGKRIIAPSTYTSVLINKPAGVVCSMSDDKGREDLLSLLSQYPQRLFHVGRLDTQTSGLLLATNHGELAHRLAHPSYEVTKTYVALVAGIVSPATAARALVGVELDDGLATADRFVIKDQSRGKTLVELDIHMGRNRIVRRMLDGLGHRVLELSRTRFGPLRLAGLGPRQSKVIASDELGPLFDTVGM